MLEGNVQVRQYLALGHQGNDFVDMRVGIHIVQPRPDAELGQRLAKLRHVRLDWAAVPEPAAELDIDAVGAGVLRDNQQFLDPCLDQDRKSTRLTPVTNAHLVCRLLLEKKNKNTQ